MDNQVMAFAYAFLALICAVLVVFLIVTILYLLTLQRALSRVSKRNRLMEPSQVFLCLIPIFNLYWSFKTVSAVSDSLQREFADLGADDGTDHAKKIGIIGLAIGIACNFGSNIGVPAIQSIIGIGALAATQSIFGIGTLASLALWIVYWVKIAGYGKRLRQIKDDDRGRDDDDRDDRDDRRPPRRSAPRDQGDEGITKPRRDDRIR